MAVALQPELRPRNAVWSANTTGRGCTESKLFLLQAVTTSSVVASKHVQRALPPAKACQDASRSPHIRQQLMQYTCHNNYLRRPSQPINERSVHRACLQQRPRALRATQRQPRVQRPLGQHTQQAPYPGADCSHTPLTSGTPPRPHMPRPAPLLQLLPFHLKPTNPRAQIRRPHPPARNQCAPSPRP